MVGSDNWSAFTRCDASHTGLVGAMSVMSLSCVEVVVGLVEWDGEGGVEWERVVGG